MTSPRLSLRSFARLLIGAVFSLWPLVMHSQDAQDPRFRALQAMQAAQANAAAPAPTVTYQYNGKPFVFHPVPGTKLPGTVGAYQITEDDNLVNTAGPDGVFYPVPGAADANLARDAFKAWKAAGMPGATPIPPAGATGSGECAPTAKVEQPDNLPLHRVVHMLCGPFAGRNYDFFPKNSEFIYISAVIDKVAGEDVTTQIYTARFEGGKANDSGATKAGLHTLKVLQGATSGTTTALNNGWQFVAGGKLTNTSTSAVTNTNNNGSYNNGFSRLNPEMQAAKEILTALAEIRKQDPGYVLNGENELRRILNLPPAKTGAAK